MRELGWGRFLREVESKAVTDVVVSPSAWTFQLRNVPGAKFVARPVAARAIEAAKTRASA